MGWYSKGEEWRCRLSSKGRRLFWKKDRLGIAWQTRGKQTISVRWDGNTTTTTYHPDFIERVERAALG